MATNLFDCHCRTESYLVPSGTKIVKVEGRSKQELVLSLALPRPSYLRETKIVKGERNAICKTSVLRHMILHRGQTCASAQCQDTVQHHVKTDISRLIALPNQILSSRIGVKIVKVSTKAANLFDCFC